MPAHPQVQILLDLLASAAAPTIADQTPDDARQMYTAMHAMYAPGEDVGAVSDAAVPTGDGNVPVRIYRPAGAGPHPALVWFHGGGWVIGDLDTADGMARTLCNRSGAVVVSVDYRLAPEHRFPAAADDCLAATRWVAEHSAELDVDPSRLAVGGDSAGGNLAAVVALRCRDEGGPALRHQLLLYPVTDCTATQPSHDENAEGYLLTHATMVWFIDHYLGDGDQKDPLASPLFADDLSGLAPATVITTELDPLRDEGEAFAARLRDAGVPISATRYDGQIHGFASMLGVLDDAGKVLDEVGAALRASLA